MVKVQNKTRRSVEAVQKTPKFKKALNPFEVFLNKVKIRFLNKKTNHDGVFGKIRKTEATDYKSRNRRIISNRTEDACVPCSIENSKKKPLLIDEQIWTYSQQNSKEHSNDYLKGLETLKFTFTKEVNCDKLQNTTDLKSELSSNTEDTLESNTSICNLTNYDSECKEILLIVANIINEVDDQMQLQTDNNILQSFKKMDLPLTNISEDSDISVSNSTLSMNTGITTVSVHDVILKKEEREEPVEDTYYIRKKAKRNSKLVKRSKIGFLEKEDLAKDSQQLKLLDLNRDELQSVYGLPENYEQLRELLQDKPSRDQSVIIERMIMYNHLSLQEENMIEVSNLFEYLLRHLSDICCDLNDCEKCFDVFTCLTPQFFDLAKLNPERAHISLLDVIQEKQTEYSKDATTFPGFDIILYLNLSYQLFTEKELQLLTPNLVFMEEMLTRCEVKTRADVAYGLFLVTLIAQYTSLSKRCSLACVNYLSEVLRIATPDSEDSTNFSCNLVLTEPVDSIDNTKLDIKDLTEGKDFDERFCVRVINVSLGLLVYFHKCCQSLPSCSDFFEKTLIYLKHLPVKYYPKELNESIVKFIHDLEQYNKDRKLKFIIMDRIEKPTSQEYM